MLFFVKNKIREYIYKRYHISFSQGGGDDIQLKKIIKNTTPGVYVDIGAWHPVKASNTYYFYLRGWKGICIDPNPKMEKLYRTYRPKDSFINCAIGSKQEELIYYQLQDGYSAMNTFNLEFLERKNLEQHIKSKNRIKLYQLKDILDEQIKENDRLDFFDIDVEGLDLEVLKTNDWEKYRPKVILIETNLSIQEELNSDIVVYLNSVGYAFVAKSVIEGNLGNLFFTDSLNS